MTETTQRPPIQTLDECQDIDVSGGTRRVTTRPVTANHQYGGAYRAQLEESARTGKCIFCDESFQTDPTHFLFQARNWIIRHNGYPTKDAEGSLPEYHFLIIPKFHISGWEEITSRGHQMISRLIRNVREAYQIKGGGLVHQLGDPIWSGATIPHLHIHFVVPRVKLVNGVPVAVPVYMPIG